MHILLTDIHIFNIFNIGQINIFFLINKQLNILIYSLNNRAHISTVINNLYIHNSMSEYTVLVHYSYGKYRMSHKKAQIKASSMLHARFLGITAVLHSLAPQYYTCTCQVLFFAPFYSPNQWYYFCI